MIICDLIIKPFRYKTSFMVNICISEDKSENVYKHLFNYIVVIFFIRLHKADYFIVKKNIYMVMLLRWTMSPTVLLTSVFVRNKPDKEMFTFYVLKHTKWPDLPFTGRHCYSVLDFVWKAILPSPIFKKNLL